MRVGISGYMGAGKTTCVKSFTNDQVCIIDADSEAKKVMRSDPRIAEDLCKAFGSSVVDSTGLRFEELAKIAFGSLEQLKILNSISHPPLLLKLKSMIEVCRRPVCILDAALIPLWRIENWFDICIWVDAPFNVRLQRLRQKKKDVPDSELVLRMKMQEQLLGLPEGPHWVKVEDSVCREFLNEKLERKYGTQL